ncbi:MAG: hypothetical protein IKS90_04355 [Clostridia bacterium]|nr:hypothetical protein [Clostridia bacterium]
MKNADKKSGTLRGLLTAVAVNGAILLIVAVMYILLFSAKRGTLAVSASSPHFSAEGAVYKGASANNVALVIKLEWNTARLEELLAVLDAHGARATFAVSESVLWENGASVRGIAARGHEIALMCDDEKPSEAALRSALAAADNASIARPEFYYCGRNADNAEKRTAKKLGLLPVIGSVDIVSQRGTKDEILRRVRGGVSGGDIVILSPSAPLLEALDGMLTFFSSAGLTATTVSGTIYH